MTGGASKYGDYNWQSGLDYSRQFAALQRHAWKFWGGQDHDEDSGHHELLHIAANCMMLYWHTQNSPERDDRPKKKLKEGFENGKNK